MQNQPLNFDEIMALRPFGFDMIPLETQGKKPIQKNWTTNPMVDERTLEAAVRSGCNIGVRLGVHSTFDGRYWHCCDVDVRDPKYADEANRALATLLPELPLASCPTVMSGSGGASRHHYFVCDKPFRSKVFARSVGLDVVWDERLKRDVRKRHWELHLLGTGSQAVLPPSIHPNGNPYRWLIRPEVDQIAELLS